MSDQTEVTADEMGTMSKEITLGISPEHSSLEMTPERRVAWERLRAQIAEIKRRGGIVDIPE